MHITHFYAEKKITLHRDQQIKERGIQHNKILSLMSSRFCCKYAYAYPFCYNERCNSFRPRNSLFPLLSKEKSKGENPLKKIWSFFFFFFLSLELASDLLLRVQLRMGFLEMKTRNLLQHMKHATLTPCFHAPSPWTLSGEIGCLKAIYISP